MEGMTSVAPVVMCSGAHMKRALLGCKVDSRLGIAKLPSSCAVLSPQWLAIERSGRAGASCWSSASRRSCGMLVRAASRSAGS